MQASKLFSAHTSGKALVPTEICTPLMVQYWLKSVNLGKKVLISTYPCIDVKNLPSIKCKQANFTRLILVAKPQLQRHSASLERLKFRTESVKFIIPFNISTSYIVLLTYKFKVDLMHETIARIKCGTSK